MAPHTDPPREPSPAAAAARNEMLDDLQRETFSYFTYKSNPANGLIADTTEHDAPASIAAVGLGLTAFPIGVERGLMTREDAVQRTLAACRFFWKSPHGTSPDAIGHKGFYYHFLDMRRGRRAGIAKYRRSTRHSCSPGCSTAALYFSDDSEPQRRIRATGPIAVRPRPTGPGQRQRTTPSRTAGGPRADSFRINGKATTKACCFTRLRSARPRTHCPRSAFEAWASTYEWKRVYDIGYLYSAPLFTHQLSHAWIDFRGIQDDFMRTKGIDYFENTRRATLHPATLRDRQSARLRRLRSRLLGHHGQRRPRTCDAQGRR